MSKNSLVFTKDGVPLKFAMRTCSVRNEIKLLVEQNGGILRRKGGINVFRIADPSEHLSYDGKDVIISLQFIYDCIKQNALLDMKSYIIKTENFILPDSEDFLNEPTILSKTHQVVNDKDIVNYILENQKLFIKLDVSDFLKKLRSDLKVTFSNSKEFIFYMRKICKFINSYNLPCDSVLSLINACIFKNILPFYRADDKNILNYIINRNSYKQVSNLEFWEKLVLDKVTQHDARSMFLRFHHTILPNLYKYNLSSTKLKKFANNMNFMTLRSNNNIFIKKLKQQLQLKVTNGDKSMKSGTENKKSRRDEEIIENMQQTRKLNKNQFCNIKSTNTNIRNNSKMVNVIDKSSIKNILDKKNLKKGKLHNLSCDIQNNDLFKQDMSSWVKNLERNEKVNTSNCVTINNEHNSRKTSDIKELMFNSERKSLENLDRNKSPPPWNIFVNNLRKNLELNFHSIKTEQDILNKTPHHLNQNNCVINNVQHDDSNILHISEPVETEFEVNANNEENIISNYEIFNNKIYHSDELISTKHKSHNNICIINESNFFPVQKDNVEENPARHTLDKNCDCNYNAGSIERNRIFEPSINISECSSINNLNLTLNSSEKPNKSCDKQIVVKVEPLYMANSCIVDLSVLNTQSNQEKSNLPVCKTINNRELIDENILNFSQIPEASDANVKNPTNIGNFYSQISRTLPSKIINTIEINDEHMTSEFEVIRNDQEVQDVSIGGLRKTLESKFIKLDYMRKKLGFKLRNDDEEEVPIPVPPTFYRSKLETIKKSYINTPLANLCDIS